MCLTVIPILSTKATVVLGPTDIPPSGYLVSELMQHLVLKAIFAPPFVYEQLAQKPGAIEQVKQLAFLLYAGGPLTEATGSALSKCTCVCQFYGSTETNGIPTLLPSREDWAYLEFHPSYGAELRPSEDDAFELVLERKSTSREACVFSCNFPKLTEYHTNDLFRPHPTKPNLWKFHGRKDDILAQASGARFNPVPSETIIAAHPLLSGALMVGAGKVESALLIEAKPEVELEVEKVVDEVWPTVKQANLQLPAFCRIRRNMIIVAQARKRFERASKGTVIRKLTVERFATEIDGLYTFKQDQHEGNNGQIDQGRLVSELLGHPVLLVSTIMVVMMVASFVRVKATRA